MKSLLRIVFVGAFLVGGAVNAALPKEQIDTMINTARAARLPIQHQLTYLLGAVDDLGDPKDCKFAGVDNLLDPFKLTLRIQRHGEEWFNDLPGRITSHLTRRLNHNLAASKSYIDETFTRALGNFEANLQARVIVTTTPAEPGDSEYATSRRISIGMNIRSVEAGLAEAKASIAAWQATYTEKASQMHPSEIESSVLKVLGNMDASEQNIISWGSV